MNINDHILKTLFFINFTKRDIVYQQTTLSVSKFPLPIYPPFSQSSLVCEGKALKIGCKANEKIKIFSVFYGRNNHNT